MADTPGGSPPDENGAAPDGIVVPAGGVPRDVGSDSNLVLWYRRPAGAWLEALPVGNGRLGAMVFGGVERERLQLNEETVWSGGPRDTTNPAASGALPEVRRLLGGGQPVAALALAEAEMMGRPLRLPPYQTLGDMWLELDGDNSAGASERGRESGTAVGPPAGAGEYRRELDLDAGVARVVYVLGGARFTREVFCSAVDQVLVVRLSCDRPGRIGFGATLTREPDVVALAAGPDRLELRGRCDGGRGLAFQATLRAFVEGDDAVVAGDRPPRVPPSALRPGGGHPRVRTAHGARALRLPGLRRPP